MFPLDRGAILFFKRSHICWCPPRQKNTFKKMPKELQLVNILVRHKSTLKKKGRQASIRQCSLGQRSTLKKKVDEFQLVGAPLQTLEHTKGKNSKKQKTKNKGRRKLTSKVMGFSCFVSFAFSHASNYPQQWLFVTTMVEYYMFSQISWGLFMSHELSQGSSFGQILTIIYMMKMLVD